MVSTQVLREIARIGRHYRLGLARIVNVLCSTVTSTLFWVHAGQVGLDVVAAIPGSVNVHGHAERGTRPGRGHRQ